ncbi:hypothetical protein V6R21_15885 [Limibacter armeniacum]|uniref:hypothetical protein n=1 Tax=Limibacter armeniacum TaxID=466084 RepID=UPI002FE5B931
MNAKLTIIAVFTFSWILLLPSKGVSSELDLGNIETYRYSYEVKQGDTWTRLTIKFLQKAGIENPVPYSEVVSWLQFYVGGDEMLYAFEKVHVNIQELVAVYHYTERQRAIRLQQLRKLYESQNKKETAISKHD